MIAKIRPEFRGAGFFYLEAKPGDYENAELVEHIVPICKERGLDKLRGAYSYLVMPHYDPKNSEAVPIDSE